MTVLQFHNNFKNSVELKPACLMIALNSASIKLFMIGYYYLREGIISPHHNMASFLPLEIITCLLQSFNAFTSGYHRQFAHTTARRASKRSSGMARPSSFNALIYAWIASFNIGDCLLTGLSLADATRETWNFCHPIVVLARVDHHLPHRSY